MRKPLLCALGIHAFGTDGEGPDPENPTRLCALAYCRRGIGCNKRRVNGKVVTIPVAMQSEREARSTEHYAPLPPAPKDVTDHVNASPRVFDDDDEFFE